MEPHHMPRKHSSVLMSFYKRENIYTSKEEHQKKPLILRVTSGIFSRHGLGSTWVRMLTCKADLRNCTLWGWGQGPAFKPDSASDTAHKNLNLNNESEPLITRENRKIPCWEQVVSLWRTLTSGSQSWLHPESTCGAFIKLPITS